jgi:hypothetical protein
MKTIRIELGGLELFCKVKLDSEDNIDNGFEIIKISLVDNDRDVKSIVDENLVCKLIHEELKKGVFEKQTAKDKILEEYNNGNIVFSDFEGLKSCKIDDFLSQPLEGILYDLNRNESVILTFIEDIKWVNDFALTKLLRHLHSKLEKYEKEASTISQETARTEVRK